MSTFLASISYINNVISDLLTHIQYRNQIKEYLVWNMMCCYVQVDFTDWPAAFKLYFWNHSPIQIQKNTTAHKTFYFNPLHAKILLKNSSLVTYNFLTLSCLKCIQRIRVWAVPRHMICSMEMVKKRKDLT